MDMKLDVSSSSSRSQAGELWRNMTSVQAPKNTSNFKYFMEGSVGVAIPKDTNI